MRAAGDAMPRRLESLDVLRGIAAFSVMLHHIYEQYYLPQSGPKNSFFAYLGPWGVSIFFVLSGMCIHLPQALRRDRGDKSFAHKEFAVRRIFRIAPAYYVSLFLCLIIGLFHGTLLIGPPAGALDVVSHLIFLNNLYPGGIYSINSVFWTVTLEVQFYLVYFLLYRYLDFSARQFLLFFAVGVGTGLLAAHFIPQDSLWYEEAIWSVASTFWTWYLGAVLAEWTVKRDCAVFFDALFKNRLRLFLFLGLAVFLNFIFPFSNPRLFNVHPHLWIFPASSALLIVAIVELEKRRGFDGLLKDLKLFQWIGAISYSLYILHPIAIYICVFYVWKYSALSKLTCVFLAIAMAAASHAWVEKPSMDMGKRIAKKYRA